MHASDVEALQTKANSTRVFLDTSSKIRDGDDKDPRLEALRKELLSDKMRAFILEKYQGAVIPVLSDCR